MSDTLEDLVIAAIARKKDRPRDAITLESALTELGIDSLDGIELMFELEDSLNITISDQAVQNMRTVGDVVAAIRAVAGDVTPTS